MNTIVEKCCMSLYAEDRLCYFERLLEHDSNSNSEEFYSTILHCAACECVLFFYFLPSCNAFCFVHFAFCHWCVGGKKKHTTNLIMSLKNKHHQCNNNEWSLNCLEDDGKRESCGHKTVTIPHKCVTFVNVAFRFPQCRILCNKGVLSQRAMASSLQCLDMTLSHLRLLVDKSLFLPS